MARKAKADAEYDASQRGGRVHAKPRFGKAFETFAMERLWDAVDVESAGQPEVHGLEKRRRWNRAMAVVANELNVPVSKLDQLSDHVDVSDVEDGYYELGWKRWNRSTYETYVQKFDDLWKADPDARAEQQEHAAAQARLLPLRRFVEAVGQGQPSNVVTEAYSELDEAAQAELTMAAHDAALAADLELEAKRLRAAARDRAHALHKHRVSGERLVARTETVFVFPAARDRE